MKILLDANISWKLINRLSSIFGECSHVDSIGLKIPPSDIDIWKYALKHNMTIFTKDSDFVDLLDVYGFPPKIVIIKTGNSKNNALEELLLKSKDEIVELEKSDFGLLKIIDKRL